MAKIRAFGNGGRCLAVASVTPAFTPTVAAFLSSTKQLYRKINIPSESAFKELSNKPALVLNFNNYFYAYFVDFYQVPTSH